MMNPRMKINMFTTSQVFIFDLHFSDFHFSSFLFQTCFNLFLIFAYRKKHVNFSSAAITLFDRKSAFKKTWCIYFLLTNVTFHLKYRRFCTK